MPLALCVPVQPFDTAQLVAFVLDHVSVDVPPTPTVVGLALKVTVGVAEFTATVTELACEPPVPVQDSVYVVPVVSAPVDWEPLVPRLPVQPPDAVQELAFVELQVSVAADPEATLVGLALKETVGTGTTVTVILLVPVPPAPAQLSM